MSLSIHRPTIARLRESSDGQILDLYIVHKNINQKIVIYFSSDLKRSALKSRSFRYRAMQSCYQNANWIINACTFIVFDLYVAMKFIFTVCKGGCYGLFTPPTRTRQNCHRNWVETRQNCLVGGVNKPLHLQLMEFMIISKLFLKHHESFFTAVCDLFGYFTSNLSNCTQTSNCKMFKSNYTVVK